MSEKAGKSEKSKKILFETLERISDAFVALDKNWCYTYMNKRAGEIFSRDPAKMTGKHIWSEFPEGIDQPFYKAYYKAMETQQYIYLEEHYAPYNLWFENHIYPSPEGLTIYFCDITERKRAEEKIIESEEQYRSLFENSGEAILLTTTDGRICSANPEACRIFDRSEAEICNLGRNSLVNLNDPRLPLALEERKKTRKLKSELTFVRKDGTVFPGEITSNVFTTVAGEERTSMLIRDISERKKAEENLAEKEQQLRLFIENSPAALAMFDKDMKYIIASKRFVLDYKIQDRQLIGKSHYEIFPEISQYWKEIHIRCLAGAIEKSDADFFEREDGSIDWVSWEIHPWYNTRDEIGGIILFSEVITERKKAEAEIKKAYEQLRLLTSHLQDVRDEERKRIGREIHDDLGQQLTAVKMDVAWIDKKIPEETTILKKKLKNIIRLLDGSNQSIRRILTELRPVIFDDYDLLDALKWLDTQFAANTGIPVKFNTDLIEIKSSEPIITCIFRVYQEALTNITRYAKAKTVIASVSLTVNTIMVTIEDDGIGFDIASIQTHKSFGMLGMKERVVSLGGKFELVSSPGNGTRICVQLPYH
ncbi:MAG: PAS domain S-box protein [Bacteroidota bacterium]|nr:PAS domain S-box protein [Bacteroidota bacterium]